MRFSQKPLEALLVNKMIRWNPRYSLHDASDNDPNAGKGRSLIWIVCPALFHELKDLMGTLSFSNKGSERGILTGGYAFQDCYDLIELIIESIWKAHPLLTLGL